MRAAGRKDHPLSMRLPAADLAIIDRAAGLRGRSRMSRAGFAAFREAIEAPAAPVRELVELLRRPAPWEPDADG
jgi:uncharacterized protein (DUF1778 family)